jgi:hypothetical protein
VPGGHPVAFLQPDHFRLDVAGIGKAPAVA